MVIKILKFIARPMFMMIITYVYFEYIISRPVIFPVQIIFTILFLLIAILVLRSILKTNN